MGRLSPAADAGIAGPLRRIQDALPQGRTLPDGMWLRRHRWLLRLLWFHVPAVFGFALLQGNSVGHSAMEGGVIASFAGLAALMPLRHRRAASYVVALGLLTSSAVITHLSGGYIEAHFHFFVVVTLLVLYEDWVAFLLAIGYVLVHHGLGSALMAETVFNHPDAVSQPWKWAAIHAGFISALSVGSIVSWRLNEEGRTETERALRVAQTNEERFRSAFANAPIGMALMDASPGGDGHFVRVNVALCEMTGYTEEELLGQTFRGLTHTDDLPKTDAAARALLDGSVQVYENEKRYVHADGHSIPTLVTSSLMRDEAGEPHLYICQIQDITARKIYEERLAHQALHDSLTGLPNRALFRDRLEQALARTSRDRSAVSVLFLDLDRFKLVNDTYGHAVGDEVLKAAAARIQATVRPADTVARFGGDEFAILCETREATDAPVALAERLAQALGSPLDAAHRRVVLSGSIGIVVTEDSAADPDAMLRDADAAMYRAKEAGGGQAQLFHAELREEVLQRVDTEHALREALAHEQFVLHYQPIVDIESGTVEAFEALIRWNRPGHELVSPDAFIGVAEETGLIVPIGAWVLREACAEATRWPGSSEDGEGPKVSVNLSARQLADPDLVYAVTYALEESGLSPSRLSLELTETAMMENLEEATETMHFLNRLGVELALDDFGTGYSSLGQLKRLPAFDVLKIDRSFTAGIGTERHARALISAAVDMSRSLGLRAVAEGVETAEQLEHLREAGCPLAQGYLYSRPMSAAAVGEMLRAAPRASASGALSDDPLVSPA